MRSPARLDLIRTSMCDTYSCSTKLPHTWIMPVIVRQHLLQTDRLDGPTEYSSRKLAAVRSNVGRRQYFAVKRRRFAFRTKHGEFHNKCSVCPSIQIISTKGCFTMTNMIQVCSNSHRVRVLFIDTCPDENALTFLVNSAAPSTNDLPARRAPQHPELWLWHVYRSHSDQH